MADVLSQSEIDALLSAISTGELDANEIKSNEHVIKDYDFKRPSKFSREHLKTLEIIHDNYSRQLSSYLSGFLRLSSHVQVESVEALTYKEFSGALFNPLVFTLINFKPLKGSIMMKLSSKIAFGIIDRILGGQGSELKKDREFTEIESVLLLRFAEKLAEMMREPWNNFIDVKPTLEKMETNVQFAEIIEPNEMVALITLNIRIGDIADMVNICIPHMTIEPIMNRLNTKQWFSVKRDEEHIEDYKGKLESKLGKITIPIRAVLGECNITVNDLLNLQIGDVVKLNQDVKSTLKVLVGNIYKFDARPGLCRKRNAILVNKVRREEKVDG